MSQQAGQSQAEQQQEAQQALDVVWEISRLLNTGLNRQTVSVLTSLCESGVNPEALAAVVKELQLEAAARKVCLANFLYRNPDSLCLTHVVLNYISLQSS